MKVTNHVQEFRRRTTLDCSEPKITDQSFKRLCDVNVIMENYAKTGMFSHVNSKEPKYIDNTTIPNLEEAFDIVTRAENLFYELPAEIRKLMDNDPSKLESFVFDQANKEMLLKHGIITEQKTPQKTDIQELTETFKQTRI